MISGIYAITNTETGKCYVGQSVDIARRLNSHFKQRGHQSALYLAMEKYGADKFICSILERCSVENMNDAETWWMQQMNSIAPNGYNLMNEGRNGRRHSTESRQKMSFALAGRSPAVNSMERKPEWEEARLAALRAYFSSDRYVPPMKGRKASPETREKMSKKRLGRKHTKEAIAKMSLACTGRRASPSKLAAIPNRKPVVRSDGVVFDSVSTAARDSGVQRANIQKVLRGDRTHVGGFGFEWVTEQHEASK